MKYFYTINNVLGSLLIEMKNIYLIFVLKSLKTAPETEDLNLFP